MTWRTAFPARRVIFLIDHPAPKHDVSVEVPRGVSGRGRTRFRLTLHPQRPSRVRRLIITGHDFEGDHERKVTVPVTG